MDKAPIFKSDEDREKYLKEHVRNDLIYCLSAATEWYIQKELNLEIVGYQMQVYAMDSVFLHGRALFEFLTENNLKETKCDECGKSEVGSRLYYTVLDFGLSSSLVSTFYSKRWKNQIHSHAGIHLQNRNNNKKLKARDDTTKDLNDMPLDFAREICILWREFIKKLSDPKLKIIAENSLTEAISTADNVRKSVNETTRNKYPQDCKLFPDQIIK